MAAAMIGEQLQIDTAPLTNDEGVQMARRQLDRMSGTDWDIDYDKAADTLFLRKRGAGAAISYISPVAREIAFRLDVQTGELTGVDLTEFGTKLAPETPAFQELLNDLRVAKWFARLPWLRKLGRNAVRGVEWRAREEIQGQLCLVP